ncbi:MAG: hypothetical protein EBU84_16805, partial [Actinobacteria bacterium]|nr:hypothetical protein [Actinomycetota bacterium]
LGAYSVADDSRAFLDAFKQIESILELRLRRGQKESAAGYRQRVRSEKINELKNLIQQLKPITDEIDELKAYLAELEAK